LTATGLRRWHATKSRRITIRAKQSIDTSGDADLAQLSGAPCLQGRDGDKLIQPMTMKFRMRGVDLGRVKQYMIDHPDEFYKKTPVDELPHQPTESASLALNSLYE
jgi:hypothetical protein